MDETTESNMGLQDESQNNMSNPGDILNSCCKVKAFHTILLLTKMYFLDLWNIVDPVIHTSREGVWCRPFIDIPSCREKVTNQ